MQLVPELLVFLRLVNKLLVTGEFVNDKEVALITKLGSIQHSTIHEEWLNFCHLLSFFRGGPRGVGVNG